MSWTRCSRNTISFGFPLIAFVRRFQTSTHARTVGSLHYTYRPTARFQAKCGCLPSLCGFSNSALFVLAIPQRRKTRSFGESPGFCYSTGSARPWPASWCAYPSWSRGRSIRTSLFLIVYLISWSLSDTSATINRTPYMEGLFLSMYAWHAQWTNLKAVFRYSIINLINDGYIYLSPEGHILMTKSHKLLLFW